MSSNIITEDMLKSSAPESDSIVSVLISNYPLSNGGYLVTFGRDEPDGTFKNYDPSTSPAYEDSLLAKHLDFDPVFLPVGCFYLPDAGLASFIDFLISGASFCKMQLLTASSKSQSLILVQINESNLSKYEQEEENKE